MSEAVITYTVAVTIDGKPVTVEEGSVVGRLILDEEFFATTGHSKYAAAESEARHLWRDFGPAFHALNMRVRRAVLDGLLD